MSEIIIEQNKDLGAATAYGYAKQQGYAGTEEEYAVLMASYASVAQEAKGYAEDAEAARDEITGMSAEATTLEPESSATASYSDGVLTLGIPMGSPGEKGDDGDPGYSPTISVEAIAGGHRLTVTDADGTKSFDVMDGAAGEDGAPGATGPAGPGVPKGGVLGQVLYKGLGGDYVTRWGDVYAPAVFEISADVDNYGICLTIVTPEEFLQAYNEEKKHVVAKVEKNGGFLGRLPIQEVQFGTDQFGLHLYAVFTGVLDTTEVAKLILSAYEGNPLSGTFITAPLNVVPSGGSSGYVLKKASGTDYDVEWAAESGGGGGAVDSVNGQTGTVVLTASDVGALPSTTTIPAAATADPADLGTKAKGTSTKYAREDHVHKMPSASDVGAYALPTGGIPATDLASSVQTSLGKADTALQSAPVTSVNSQTGAVTLSIPATAADVGAIAAPASPATGAFLVWNGTAWVAQTLATWQAGSY